MSHTCFPLKFFPDTVSSIFMRCINVYSHHGMHRSFIATTASHLHLFLPQSSILFFFIPCITHIHPSYVVVWSLSSSGYFHPIVSTSQHIYSSLALSLLTHQRCKGVGHKINIVITIVARWPLTAINLKVVATVRSNKKHHHLFVIWMEQKVCVTYAVDYIAWYDSIHWENIFTVTLWRSAEYVCVVSLNIITRCRGKFIFSQKVKSSEKSVEKKINKIKYFRISL